MARKAKALKDILIDDWQGARERFKKYPDDLTVGYITAIIRLQYPNLMVDTDEIINTTRKMLKAGEI